MTILRFIAGDTDTRTATVNANLATSRSVTLELAPDPLVAGNTSIRKSGIITAIGATSTVDFTLTPTELTDLANGVYVPYVEVENADGTVTTYPTGTNADRAVIDPDPTGS